jgi:hypothetical protein
MPDLALDLGSNFSDNIYWEPDCPQVTGLLAESDEFNAGVLDPKWQLWRPGGAGNMTAGVANGQAQLTLSAAGTTACGIFQPLPAALTEFTFAAKLTCSEVVNASACRYGIFLGADLVGAPTTAQTRSVGPRVDNTTTSAVVSGSLASHAAAYVQDVAYARRDSSCYVRARVSGIGTTPHWETDWSDDASGYQQLDALNVFTPLYFGIWGRNVGGIPCTIRCEWFRVLGFACAQDAQLPGGRLIPFT